MNLRAVPLSVRAANELVARLHRHHHPCQGGLWAIGAEAGGEIVGAAIVGRPVSRMLQDGETAELIRLVTREDVPNVPSFLLARVRRAAFIMGYRRVLTYTLPDEGGAGRVCGPQAGFSSDRPAEGTGTARSDNGRTATRPRQSSDGRHAHEHR